ncbi:MAG TPA: transglycosylase SLT domain-containing protein [Methanosarcinales archaeon]|nr:transglycosylase SLT domain-containing protein [Methanosarcinales archaeon]
MQKVIDFVKKNLTVITLILILVMGFHYNAKLSRLNRENIKRDDIRLRIVQGVDAGITFQTKRQKWILKARDIIFDWAKKSGIKMSSALAFKIAESNLYHSEKYSVDPNLLLSIQKRESAYNRQAVSSAGARGLNQLWEPTAKMLCRIKDWEYSPEMLDDIDKSNELACLLIQSLDAHYNDVELVLAAYNGGYRQASYYRSKSPKLAEETKEYIPIVMEYYKAHQKVLGQYING